MWHQLEATAKVDDPNNPELTSFEVWCERDGKRVAVDSYSEEFTEVNGAVFKRDIWLARQGGYPGTRPYRLALRDDQGAFALPSASVELPRGVPIRIQLSVIPQGNTQHAFLRLIDVDKNVAMHEISLDVRAPQRMKPVV